MSNTCTPMLNTLIDFPVYDCAGIDALDQALKSEADRSASMTAAQISAEVAIINSALNKISKAITKKQEALTKNKKELALESIGVSIDILVETCVFARNPVCIGSAYGVKIIYDGAIFGVQMHEAKSTAEKAQIAIAFGKGRVAMFKDLIDAMEPKTPAEAAKRAIEAAVSATNRLYDATSTVSDAKNALDKLEEELKNFKARYDPILVNDTTYKKYRQSDFESRRFILKVIKAGYGAKGCKTDVLPIPLP
jgi:archaellum component FlaG (FlaF/FlaG flagellin family)